MTALLAATDCSPFALRLSLATLALFLCLWLGNYACYRLFNHGLAPNAKLQQLLRYLVASVVAVLPVAVSGAWPFQPTLLLVLLVSALWSVSYPLTYHLTHRRHSPDYDHQIDGAVAIYLYALLSGLALLVWWLPAVLLPVALAIPLVLWGYYLTCHHVLDVSGMKMLQETHYNEILEFLRSYSAVRVAAAVVAVAALLCVAVGVPLWHPVTTAVHTHWWQLAVAAAVALFSAWYLWKPRHGLFARAGAVQLYLTVNDYVKQNSHYTANQQERLARLQAACQHPLASPHTLLLVIGESASRDFMSAFTPMAHDTTPWLRTLAADSSHCLLFPNAYSCDIQTVPTLEKALTEYNQYDGGRFYDSCSVVDMAHKLGYRVHWYSNQGHLGAADTPITLVAETSDVAKWTKQELGKAQYDTALLDFLGEVSPEANNLVVLHLKGSHFNYENRFTEDMRQWGAPGSHDQVTNYKNTLYFTDSVLHRAFDYCRQQLNLQAMVYFSDHADVPDRHRQPNFGGFRDVRIPLMVWMGDDYVAQRPHRAAALRAHRDAYWTNDLAYDLLCGIMDARSNHFSPANSLADEAYRYRREDLTAMNGAIRIADDTLRVGQFEVALQHQQ